MSLNENPSNGKLQMYKAPPSPTAQRQFMSWPLRKRVRSQLSWFQTSEHKTDGRGLDHGFARLRQPLVVSDEPAAVHEPGERPFHDPPSLLHHEAPLARRLANQLQHPMTELLGP